MSRSSIFTPFSAFFLLFLTFSLYFGCFIITSDARADPLMLRIYWKTRMKNDEPMPKAIQDLVGPMDRQATNDDHPHPATGLDNGFVRDFETTPNVIIYHMSSSSSHLLHDHVQSQESKPSNN